MAKNGCRTKEEKADRTLGMKEEDLPPFRVKFHDGKRQLMIVGEDGAFELRDECSDGTWRPMGKYYGSLEGLFAALLRRKVSNSEARTIEDILSLTARIRKELLHTFDFDQEDLK